MSHRPPVLFLHGAGRAGRDAWPGQWVLEQHRSCHYLESPASGADVVDRARGVVDGPAHVVAHSLVGVVALQLAARHPESVRTLTLLEPAALALALHRPLTGDHSAAMAPVFATSDDPETPDLAWSRLFSRASGFATPDVADDVLATSARRLRAMTPPWELAVDPTIVSRIPTLVHLGGGSTMYAESAEALAGDGATVRVLDGTGHRPHDDARFNDEVLEFWAAQDSAGS